MTAEVGEGPGLDLDDPSWVADPYPSFAELRKVGHAVWDPRLGLFLAARHADVGAVLRHKRLGRIFHERTPLDTWETFNWLHAESILDSEPPKHTRLRRLVSAVFTRSYVESLRPRVVELTEGLLTEAVRKHADVGTFDLLADYAEPLPVLVIAELLGVPESDQPLLRPWSQAIVRMYEYERTPELEEAARNACTEFADYVRDLARARRGGDGKDLVTALANVEDGGERLSEQELIATCVLLLNAGHEASVNAFGNGLVAAFRHRDQLDRLFADPWGTASTAVEEFLRFDAPLQLFERTAYEDVAVAGVTVPAGEKIAVLLGSANRDPEVFVDPDRFDVGRDPNPHLGFGVGIHFCLGGPLARLEMGVSLPLLLKQFPNLELVAEPERRPTFVLRGYESITVA
jgi:cytochrome P450